MFLFKQKMCVAALTATIMLIGGGASAQTVTVGVSTSASANASASSSSSAYVFVETGCQEFQAGIMSMIQLKVEPNRMDLVNSLIKECSWLRGWGAVQTASGDVFLLSRKNWRAYRKGETVTLPNGQQVSKPKPAPEPQTWREYVAGLPIFRGPWESLTDAERQQVISCQAKWQEPGKRPGVAEGCKEQYEAQFSS